MGHQDPQMPFPQRQPNQPDVAPGPDSINDRKPGRSFSDHSRPLGEDVISRGDPINGVADRARAVSVLRKAEELMASNNPSGATAEGRRHALELAAWRVGVKIEEYESISNHDREIQDLERQVMQEAASVYAQKTGNLEPGPQLAQHEISVRAVRHRG